jgi:hypothetical protein
MTIFSKLGNEIASPVNSDGTNRRIIPQDFQRWMAEVERFVKAYTSNGGLLYFDKASLDADLAHSPNTMAWVLGDSTVANNGIYFKSGASGLGFWTRKADIPYSFILLTDAGAGTANAIVATSSIPLPAAPSAALLVMNVFEANTGDVTINGKPLLTNSGNQIVPGGITAGTFLAFLDTGTSFRLLSEQATASFIPAMEALVAAAEAAQVAAEAAAAAAMGAVPNVFATNVAALEAVPTTAITAAYLRQSGRQGQFMLVDYVDFSSLIDADTEQGFFIRSTFDPTKAWMRISDLNGVRIEWFGGQVSPGAGPYTFDNTPAFDAAIAFLKTSNFGNLHFRNGVYAYLTQPEVIPVGIHLIGGGHSSSFLAGGTAQLRNFNQGTTDYFFRWDGSGIASNSTGGGMRGMAVIANAGTTGGIAIHLLAASDTQRPGYMEFSHVLVAGLGGGTWAQSLVQDG